MLFTNIGDLHALDDHFTYLTPEQKAIIERFWQSFGAESQFSQEKQHFMSVWRTLGTIYREFRESLAAQGLAYEGMVHRLAAQRIAEDDLPADFPAPGSRYVVVGFNALSECEKKLFSWLRDSGRAEFWWDYDDYYVGNSDHEAGLFLRSNIHDYPSPHAPENNARFVQSKEVVAVSAPSDSLQCKYVHTFLEELLSRGIRPDKETAIVLTDESLLLPVLYSIPEEIGAVNVTMGYPLRQTTAYSFVERLIELQRRQRRKKDGTLQFYHSDAVGILNHPYILEQDAASASALAGEIQRSQRVYVAADRLAIPGVTDAIFVATDGWEELSIYLQRVLSAVGSLPAHGDGARRREFFSVLIDNLCQIENSLKDSDLEGITVAVFASLLRKILQGIRIPYEGEPLAGIQIMGILETRNLDFENVLALSVNDDTFPGNLAVGSSFVPHNLRLAYGLPTPQHHEGVYGYYFYRLLQRASVVHMVYCSRSDDKHTGEPSRYIYQLDYESPHEVLRRSVPLSVSLSPPRPLSVPKTGDAARRLKAYLAGERTFSPTSFYAYVECPLKFCFRSIEGLRPEEEVTEEIDLPMFGTILHKAMELLYAPLCGQPSPERKIKELIGTAEVEKAVTEAVSGEYLRDKNLGSDEYSGSVLLVRDIVIRYIDSCILPYDAAHPGFVVQGLEVPVMAPVTFEADGETHTVTFAGKSDRIDLLADGKLRVVDYKTGSPHLEFRDLDALFSENSRERAAAVFQTLLYSLMISRSTGEEVQPALYYVRQMNDPGFSPLLVEGKQSVVSFTPYRVPFEAHLQRALASLFDFSEPFRQCADTSVCAYCDFREICRR